MPSLAGRGVQATVNGSTVAVGGPALLREHFVPFGRERVEALAALAGLLDLLDTDNRLPRVVLYNNNPRDNELFATMTGNFQDGSIPGKLQYGPPWWFMDQIDGIEKQVETLSNMGILSLFIGMTTDSRSFLSFPRHDYFRRIICNIIGRDIERGLMPDDIGLASEMIRNISYHNAKNYFRFEVEMANLSGF